MGREVTCGREGEVKVSKGRKKEWNWEWKEKERERSWNWKSNVWEVGKEGTKVRELGRRRKALRGNGIGRGRHGSWEVGNGWEVGKEWERGKLKGDGR